MATEVTGMSMDPEDKNYLKEQGISRSEFFRQAVAAFKRGEFAYDRSKQK